MPICFWSLKILNLTEHDDEEDDVDDDDVDDEKEGEEKEEKEDYGAFNLCVGDDGAHPLIDTQSAFSTFKLGLWRSSWVVVIKMITLDVGFWIICLEKYSLFLKLRKKHFQCRGKTCEGRKSRISHELKISPQPLFPPQYDQQHDSINKFHQKMLFSIALAMLF